MNKKKRIEWLKSASKKEAREYDGQIKELPCAVCSAYQPSDSHHCYGSNFPAKRGHRPRIPLCKEHHQGDTGIHKGKQTFIGTYGTQDELLERVEALLNG